MEQRPVQHDVVLVAGEGSAALGRAIADDLQVSFSEMVTKRFADGERYHAFPADIAEKHLVIVGSTHTDEAHLEILDLIQGGRYWNAASISVIIPFLGYSTMERAKHNSWEIPKGITRTRQIYRVRPNFVAFIDLHSEAVLHAHTGEVRTKHVWTDRLVVKKIKSLGIDDLVLVSPDYGFSKRVARLASLLNCSHTAADKDRFDTDKTIVSQVSSVVRDKTVIVCDDMIRTGGSIVQTANRCLDAGAREVFAMATHLVLAGEARQKLGASPIVKVIGSDTVPGVVSGDLIDVYSVAPLISSVLASHLFSRHRLARR
ncbi:MAG: ribose-phosphate diphosphokinase [Desulfofustis sp. PB-SRB1]|jgi:ribose-phosphate pyrophosphokinase|nr:ribose-phosphate diphosphokinase [Desulfofustis sp. PB-SRB1]MBM1001504.1 ribose-phosphate diphosphokinase [Desulfofustis sp. PB-SRB1]HBH29210.1 ribose-phosphate pyrophosphokinase [Desulfofustis sp.]HBH31789.1 ribose-phosphate pyrophosphokinase [Desulfofustis sp.]